MKLILAFLLSFLQMAGALLFFFNWFWGLVLFGSSHMVTIGLIILLWKEKQAEEGLDDYRDY
ncbi:hypothetical protein [Thalassobacillus sp. CUG 92003]|uniref:hypothetical protein n=1 Tax=Thalassobacillus sp. CUG 92003 TaxID=2736641 RepID=UPI0015E6C020|nr:hypothetical protein [Thalassobacillus sp. CUG 92003]